MHRSTRESPLGTFLSKAAHTCDSLAAGGHSFSRELKKERKHLGKCVQAAARRETHINLGLWAVVALKEGSEIVAFVVLRTRKKLHALKVQYTGHKRRV